MQKDYLKARIQDTIDLLVDRYFDDFPLDVVCMASVKTEAHYLRVLSRAIRDLYAGEISPDDMLQTMVELLDQQMRRAWREGMRQNNLDPDADMTEEWEAELQAIIDGEFEYVARLIDDVVAARDSGDESALKYDPDQPRDEAGRWTSGGSSGRSSSPYSDMMGVGSMPLGIFADEEIDEYQKYDRIITESGDWGEMSARNEGEKYLAASRYYRDEAEEWVGRLTEEEMVALRNYSTEYYVFTNEYARYGDVPDKIELPGTEGEIFEISMTRAEAATSLEEINSAIEKHPLPYDTVLYRGMEQDPGLSVGDSFSDLAPISTSLSMSVAELHGGDRDDLVVFRIEAPAGTPAAAVSAAGNNLQEMEYLLRGGTSFEVVDVSPLDGELGTGTLYTLRIDNGE